MSSKIEVLKNIWANRRYRAILWLVLYFIFFAVIIGLFKSNLNNDISKEKVEVNNKYLIEVIYVDNSKIFVDRQTEITLIYDHDNNYIEVTDEILLKLISLKNGDIRNIIEKAELEYETKYPNKKSVEKKYKLMNYSDLFEEANLEIELYIEEQNNKLKEFNITFSNAYNDIKEVIYKYVSKE